jgi:alkaline phosphatase D
MKQILLLLFILGTSLTVYSQRDQIQSGPMLGYSEMREVMVWIQLKSNSRVRLVYWPKSDGASKMYSAAQTALESESFVIKLIADAVEPGTIYSYAIELDGKELKSDFIQEFQTQSLWQWRNDPPAFSFTAGSCFYVNEEQYDRPGKPYGGGYEIIQSIQNKKPDFMIWLGDNLYLREVDWMSYTGFEKRYTHTRSLPELQPLLANVHHYATWDDHDFGPNNSDRSFKNKGMAKTFFDRFWANPSFSAEAGGGITNQFQWADCDFFMLDDRFNKTPNERKSDQREILGKQQLEWVKDALASSFAPFKFVCVGVMFLSSSPDKENFTLASPAEKLELIQFIQENKIKGVIFLTGDRHFTELSKIQEPGKVPIYDLTTSPLTSGSASAQYDNEKNDNRVEGTVIKSRNFAHISIEGPRNERVLKMDLCNTAGEMIWSRTIKASEF